MTGQPQADQPDLVEQLSAFLDGELDPESRRQVEELLAVDPQARAELKRLEMAWDFLAQLPRSEVAPSFTQTTVAMIALAEREEVEREQDPPGRRRQMGWLLTATGFLAAAVAGFLVIRELRPNDNAQLLQDLPILEHLEAYRQADNIEFLRSIQAKGYFSGKSDDYEPLSERLARVEQMSPADKEHLARRKERFQALDRAEQDRLRALNSALETDRDAEKIRPLVQPYHEWLAKLPGVQRAELLALDVDKRIDKIGQIQAEEARRATRRVSSHDAQVVLAWLEKHTLENLPFPRRNEIQKLPELERRKAVLRMVMQRAQFGEPGKWLPPFKESDMLELKEGLSEQARQQMAKAGTPQQRGQLFAEWTRQAVGDFLSRNEGGMAAGTPVSEERLKQFFENELPQEERQKLLELPPEEMQMNLRRLYFLRSRTPEGAPGQRMFRQPGIPAGTPPGRRQNSTP